MNGTGIPGDLAPTSSPLLVPVLSSVLTLAVLVVCCSIALSCVCFLLRRRCRRGDVGRVGKVMVVENRQLTFQLEQRQHREPQSSDTTNVSTCDSYNGQFHPSPPTLQSHPLPSGISPDLSIHHRSASSHSYPDALIYGNPRTAGKVPFSHSQNDGFSTFLSPTDITGRDSVVSHSPIQVWQSRTPSPASSRSSRIIASLSTESSFEMVHQVTPL